MAINKKLIHFENKANFETQLANNNILDTSIVFIKDTKEIWTHGQYYNRAGDNIIRPEWFGAINDGVTDCVKAFESAIAVAQEVAIPDSYKTGSDDSYSHGCTATIELSGGVYMLSKRITLNYVNLDGRGATLKANDKYSDACLIYTSAAFCGTITNLTLDGSMKSTRGISGPMRKGSVINVNIRDCIGYGICNNGGFECTYEKVHIGIYNSLPSSVTDYSKIIGFYTTASDSYLNNMIVVNYPIGLQFGNSGWQVNNVHVWGKPNNGVVPHIGIRVEHENITINNFYADTVMRQDPTKEWDATVNGSINGGIGVYIHNTSASSSGKRTIVNNTTVFVNAGLFTAEQQATYKGKQYVVLAKVYDNIQHPQVEGLVLASQAYYDLNKLVNLVNRGNYQRPNTDQIYDGYLWINPATNQPLFKCSAVSSKWVDSLGREFRFTGETNNNVSILKFTQEEYNNSDKNDNTLYIVE